MYFLYLEGDKRSGFKIFRGLNTHFPPSPPLDAYGGVNKVLSEGVIFWTFNKYKIINTSGTSKIYNNIRTDLLILVLKLI